jgi:tetratricopeptide (TPR) repeat protein
MNRLFSATAARGRVAVWLLNLLLLLNLCVIAFFGYQWLLHYRNRFLDKADQALIAGDKAAAIQALTRQTQTYPQDQAAAARLKTLQEEYRRRYLDAAEAGLRVGDKVAAIDAYQQQIRHYPQDYQSRLKLAQLYTDLGIYDEAESVYRNMLDAVAGDDPLHAATNGKLFRLIVGWSNGIKKEADAYFARDDFPDALAGYEKVEALRARNPALDTRGTDRTLAIRAFNNIVARRAFTLWRMGRVADPSRELVTDYDAKIFTGGRRGGRIPPTIYSQRRGMLSNFFWDYADELFRQEKWGEAADMYARAEQLRNGAQGGETDPNTPVLLLNYALSRYRAGDNIAAYRTLERINREFPYHEKARVEQLLEEVGKKVPASQRQK